MPEERAPGPGRQAAAVLILPATATVLVPALLVWRYGAEIRWGLDGILAVAPPVIGAALIFFGLRLMYDTISLFGTEGEGTLAPWDPTRRLVLRGPYRRVRNPMITGVGMVLLDEAALLGSVPILIEFAVFALANLIWIPLVEEPGLVRRFGDEYDEYRRAVPRWIPRRRPWDPTG